MGQRGNLKENQEMFWTEKHMKRQHVNYMIQIKQFSEGNL